MKASQTGQMVLSTLHTNDSIGAISRLINLGVPPYLVASSVTGVVAQRLVRRLCSCRMQVPVSATHKSILAAMNVRSDEFVPQYDPVGCPACDHTGFKGRIGVYEVLVMDGAIREAVFEGARADEIAVLARRSGFRTMQQDAMDKVKKGLTTLQEVRREVTGDAASAHHCVACDSEISTSARFCSHCGCKQDLRHVPEDGNKNGWSTPSRV